MPVRAKISQIMYNLCIFFVIVKHKMNTLNGKTNKNCKRYKKKK